MATPGNKDDDSSDSSEADETLDPLSPMFNPMKALYAKSVKLPVPNAKQFNNLSELENYMQGRDAKTLAKHKEQKPKLPGLIAERAAEQAKENVRKAALMAKYKGPSERSQTQLRRQHVTTVLTRMENYDKGPLSLLKRCVKERLRVIVIVRAAVAVKSRCRGYVIAFDKHLNMALMDVDETSLKPVKKEQTTSKKTKEAVEMLMSETEDLKFNNDSLSGKQRTKTSEMVSDSEDLSRNVFKESDKDQHKSVDLRAKLSKRTSTKSSLQSSSTELETEGSQEKFKGSGVKLEPGPSGAFWRAYKPWAEQRCYTTYEIVERHVNQLFLRGDNVVSVILDQE